MEFIPNQLTTRKEQQVFDDIKQVLESHYMQDIARPDNNTTGLRCWEIMQYVRERLRLINHGWSWSLTSD